ncbi:MAG: hypothetical protein FIA98_04595 [Anaerolineae bacterium]|nr:hypothetical protein [Anaerolineae bacterium]
MPIDSTAVATKSGIEGSVSLTSIPLNTPQPVEPKQTSSPPIVADYNLGDTTITQSIFPEESRFRNMPVRLNGIIGVPSGVGAPYPIVIILHGNHPGCPIPEGDMVDRWPCDPKVEQPNFRGFEYLVRSLAAHGYLALSINVNAENTLGFGEPEPIKRLEQIVNLHIQALAKATRGEQNKFGVELNGQADMSRLAFVGHSQGGEGAYLLTQTEALDASDAYSRHGYGPVYGLLLVAPSANFVGAVEAQVPFAVILPACDRDVFQQEGQHFYEITRLSPQQTTWASSIWLEHANHNYFNEILSDEAVTRLGRPDCNPLMTPNVQQNFLSEYAIDFLRAIFDQDTGAMTRLGMDFQTQMPDQLYGQPARIAALAPRSDRQLLLLPSNASELDTNLAGGSVTAEGLILTYCEEGYYVPAMKPGSEPCKRVNLVVPGNPAMLVVSWSQKGEALHFELPEKSDLRQFLSISLRAAVDPLSTLNKADTYQAFTIVLVDKLGNTASVQTRVDEPALQFPIGNREENDTFDGGFFTGRVPLTSIRMQLSDFTGVDLSAIREITLLFDQSSSGSLFISDFELVR